MAISPLDIHLLLCDIDVAGPTNGDHGRCPLAVPWQGLQILEQLAIHPLEQGEELFPEAAQCLFDREAVK